MENPVGRISIRLPKPLPRHLKDGEVEKFLSVVREPGTGPCSCSCCAGPPGRRGCPPHRRCGRVPEKAGLRRERKRRKGPGRLSERRCASALRGLSEERSSKAKVALPRPEGTDKGKPISVRGIQKRIEYYARRERTSRHRAIGCAIIPSPGLCRVAWLADSQSLTAIDGRS